MFQGAHKTGAGIPSIKSEKGGKRKRVSNNLNERAKNGVISGEEKETG